MERKKKWKKILFQAIKIAVGSSAAIYIAESLGLQYGASAGSITLLTIVTTKWETVRLSLYRLITFVIAVLLAAVTIGWLKSEWLGYGTYIFMILMISHLLGWVTTVSVNAVIGTHFLIARDFSLLFIRDEFLLVLIGVSIALLLNLFYDYQGQRKDLIRYMRETENFLQITLCELAAYLHNKDMQINVWDRIIEFEKRLHGYIEAAYEYQENTFQSHPGYYIDYFEMRMKQLNVLHNLHYEIKKIRTMPKQALMIADYIMYMADYVIEINQPEKQLARLQEIFAEMKAEPLPESREEFENRAVLYHILMDLEEFLIFKKRFVSGLNEKQQKLYWAKKEQIRSDVYSEDKDGRNEDEAG